MPPQVHVYKAGGMVKVEIGAGSIMGVVQPFKEQEVIKAVRIVLAHTDKLMTEWRKIHG